MPLDVDGIHEWQKIGLHINGDWVAQIMRGEIPKEIKHLMTVGDKKKEFGYSNGERLRFQLNLASRDENGKIFKQDLKAFGTDVIYAKRERLDKIGHVEIVCPYNTDTAEHLDEIDKLGTKFDVIYDESFGLAKKAKGYQCLFPLRVQGYGGGLGPDNIKEELAKIKAVQKTIPNELPRGIFIDAEGRLKSDTEDTLDLTKAQKFIDNALADSQQIGCNLYI